MKDEIKEILEELKKTADTSFIIVCSSKEELEQMPKSVSKFLSLNDKQAKLLLDYITNLQEEIKEKNEDLDLMKKIAFHWENYSEILQEQNDYLKDIVSNTELSDEIKRADKWSKRELYKINYQRLLVNGRLQEENDRLEALRQECADEILKELEKNNHLSCGVALAIRQKLIDYKEVINNE